MEQGVRREEVNREDEYSIVIESLEETKRKILEKVNHLNRQAEEVDTIIANLRKPPKKKNWSVEDINVSNGEAIYVRVVKGTYKGMLIADAVQAYLAHISPDKPVAFHVIMKALEEGEVEMGDPHKPNRFAANVKTTISTNRKRFRFDRRRDTVRLIVGQLKFKRAVRAAKAAS